MSKKRSQKKNEQAAGRHDVLLTDEQRRTLFRLREQMIDTAGFATKDPEVWVCHLVAIYISSLDLEATAPLEKIKQNARRFRKHCIAGLKNHFRRTPTAEDIVKELSRGGTVDEGIVEAIRKDFDRLNAG